MKLNKYANLVLFTTIFEIGLKVFKNKTINYGQLEFASVMIIIANSKHILTEDLRSYNQNDGQSGMSDMEGTIWDFILEETKKPIFWIMKDKARCQAMKSVAELTFEKMLGAGDRKDYNQAIKYASEGTNKIIKISIGEKTFDIIEEYLKPISILIKNDDDIDTRPIQLLLASQSLALREKLLMEGLYKGPLKVSENYLKNHFCD